MNENYSPRNRTSTSLAWDAPLYLRTVSSGACLWHTTPQRNNLLHTSIYDYSLPLSILQPIGGGGKATILQNVRRAAYSWEAQQGSSKSQILKNLSLTSYVLYSTCGFKKAGRREKEKTKPRARPDELAKREIQGVSAPKKRMPNKYKPHCSHACLTRVQKKNAQHTQKEKKKKLKKFWGGGEREINKTTSGDVRIKSHRICTLLL